MTQSKRDFIDFMLRCGVLKFGNFTTKSGRQSPYFINTGAYTNGEQLEVLAGFYAKTLHEHFGNNFDNLFGPAYKGIPLAAVTAVACYRHHQHNVTYTFNRKEAKDHGEGGLLVGYQYNEAHDGEESKSSRVILIEDVITAGTSVRETLPLLQRSSPQGAKAIGLIVSVDRMERGSGSQSALEEIESQHGLKTVSIVNFRDLMEYLDHCVQSGDTRYGLDLLNQMRSYQEKYAAV